MTEALLEAESHYDILESEDNELLVAIKARDGNPMKPTIVYAGEEHGVFYRNENLTIILDYIHPDVRGNFRKVESILIAEFQDGSIIREYMVPVKQVNQLPITDEKIQSLFN